MTTQYVVLNEHTLGYIYSAQPGWMGVLAGNIWKDGYSHGAVPLLPGHDQIRPATVADFDAFRVSATGYTLATHPTTTDTPSGAPQPNANHSGLARRSS